MKKIYRLEDLDCANCAAKIEKDTAKLEGVKSAALNLLSQKMVIECDENVADEITKARTRPREGQHIRGSTAAGPWREGRQYGNVP